MASKGKRPWGSPAQRAALAKAQHVSAIKRHLRAKQKNKGKAPDPVNRGIGTAGLKKNFTPYVRVNQRSQTVGYNVGTYVPGTNRRVVTGQYVRFERATKKGSAFNAMLGRAASGIAPKNTRRGAVRSYLKKNVTVATPAVRAAIGGAEVRVGTSRGAGPTVILRRGKHKVSQQASFKSIKRYDTHARKLNAKRQGTPRPQRRNKNK